MLTEQVKCIKISYVMKTIFLLHRRFIIHVLLPEENTNNNVTQYLQILGRCQTSVPKCANYKKFTGCKWQKNDLECGFNKKPKDWWSQAKCCATLQTFCMSCHWSKVSLLQCISHIAFSKPFSQFSMHKQNIFRVYLYRNIVPIMLYLDNCFQLLGKALILNHLTQNTLKSSSYSQRNNSAVNFTSRTTLYPGE